LRIIAGTEKGRIIKSNKGRNTRPTSDRVREAIFNVLGDKIVEASFLDLFAGTGAVGIEALSRGAKKCYFNDCDKKAFQVIKKNISMCGFEEKAKIFNMDVFCFMKHIRKCSQDKFDIIYIDPPYDEEFYLPVLSIIEELMLVSTCGLVVCETSKKKVLAERYKTLSLLKTKTYSETTVWYYILRGNKCGNNELIR